MSRRLVSAGQSLSICMTSRYSTWGPEAWQCPRSWRTTRSGWPTLEALSAFWGAPDEHGRQPWWHGISTGLKWMCGTWGSRCSKWALVPCHLTMGVSFRQSYRGSSSPWWMDFLTPEIQNLLARKVQTDPEKRTTLDNIKRDPRVNHCMDDGTPHSNDTDNCTWATPCSV